MFNVSEFKKAVKSLGRKASDIDEFCREVSMYMESEKTAVREKIVNIYTFAELSPEMQSKVLDNYRDINVDHAWWDYTYDDAEQIGLKITSSDIDRRDIEGHFVEHPSTVITTIMENHGDATETYKTAVKYKDAFTLAVDEDTEQEFLKELLEDYLQMLSNEYDYLTSDEAIKETILASEYEFTESGKIEASKKKARKRRAEQVMYIPNKIKERLEYLRGEIEAERISYGEIIELQSLSDYIDPSDVVLREWAGLPENTEASKKKADYQGWTNYESWVTALWLDNDGFTLPEEMTDVYEAADYIKEIVEGGNPLADSASMYADMLNSSIQEVNFAEIAQNMIDSRG